MPVTSLKKGSFATSLVGARDIYGRGSHFPEVTHADPFILVHFVETAMRIKPPFCAHPHMGTEVATVLLRGEEVWPWDNLKGFEKTKLHAGGIYLCSTGRGIVHDESEQPPFPDRRVMQASFDPESASGNCATQRATTDRSCCKHGGTPDTTIEAPIPVHHAAVFARGHTGVRYSRWPGRARPHRRSSGSG